MLLGGIVGAILGAADGMDNYKPVIQIILEDMSPVQRDQLADSFIKAFQKVGKNDMMMILPLLTTNDSVKAVALDVVQKFLNKEGYTLK